MEHQKDLGRKAGLGMAGDMLDSTVRLLIGLLITPMLTRLLGRDLYGAWIMINQINGYVALGNFRLSGTVKYFLALHQHSADIDYKRRMVGASLRLVFWSLPLLVFAMATVIFLAPSIFHTESTNIQAIRLTLMLTGITLLTIQFSSIPTNVLRGLNLDYKAIGLKAGALIISTLAGLGLVMTGWQLPGLAVGNFLGVVFLGVVHLCLARRYVYWFGSDPPRPTEVKSYTVNSAWISANSVGNLLLTGSDYILIGWLLAPAEAATYGLTAALARFMVSPLTSLTSASNAGIAGLCGAGDWGRVRRLKREFRQLTLLSTGLVGTVVLFVNAPFVALWVGPAFYGGLGITLIFLLQGLCTSLSQSDSNILDGLGAVREKAVVSVLAGSVAVTASVVLSVQFGALGVACGMLVGRVAAGIYFHRCIDRHRVLNGWDGLLKLRLPLCISACWAIACSLPHPSAQWSQILPACVVVGSVAAAILVFVGLNGDERSTVMSRFRQQWSVGMDKILRRR